MRITQVVGLVLISFFGISLTGVGILTDEELSAYSCGCEDSGVSVSQAQMDAVLYQADEEELKGVKVFWQSGTNDQPIIVWSPVGFRLNWMNKSGEVIGQQFFDMSVASGAVDIEAAPAGADYMGIAPYRPVVEFEATYLIPVPETGSKVTVFDDNEWVTLDNQPNEYYNGWCVNDTSVYSRVFGPDTEVRDAPRF